MLEMKNGQIILPDEDYPAILGAIAIIKLGNLNKRENFQIVPFKEIIKVVHPKRLKIRKTGAWEEIFNRAWQEMSDRDLDRTGAIYESFDILKSQYWFGTTFFWVENYYKNRANFLEKNMWIGVRHDSVYIIQVGTMKGLKKFKIADFQFYHLPNALMIGKTYESALRFTTSCSFSIFALIQRYRQRMFEEGPLRTSSIFRQ